jgi:TolB-like protein/DNA-binding winged helix-turn-helix (wHTH) protein
MAGRLRAPVQIGEWVAHPDTDMISRSGETQKLEPRTMRLLLLLAQAPGAVVSVEQMLNEVWQGVVVGPASVYQAISQLRRLLGDTDPNPTYIANVPRKGYRLLAPVSPVVSPVVSAAIPDPVPAQPPIAVLQRRMQLTTLLTIIVALMILGSSGWFIWRQRPVSSPVTSPSIVVLPFVDMTEEGHQQFFCDGLTEELSNWLAQIPTLRVVARTSAFFFRGQQDARQIGRALNTTHILEGSMRRSGDRMRITVQLIDARNGYHIWSSEYDRQIDDTLKMQEEIARSVAESLQIRLTPTTVQKFAQRGRANPQAYNLFLLASHYRQQRTREGTTHAIDLYRQALAADPNFALAYVGLAYTYLNQRYLDTRTIEDVSQDAEPLLATAEHLDPELSELYAVRGALRAEQMRRAEAQQDLQRAVTLDPNTSWAFAELGRLYLQMLRPHDAMREYARALALDPLDFLHHARECAVLSDLNRNDEASSACARARALQDEGDFGTLSTSWLAWGQGRLVEALQWNALALKIMPKDMHLYDRRADLLLILGLPDASRRVYQQALTATGDQEETDLGMAEVVFYEGGQAALKEHLIRTHLDDSKQARHLIRVAYLHLLAGEVPSARRIIDRAMLARDFNQASLNDSWYARWGESDLLIVALCEQQAGERDLAEQHLRQIGTMLDEAIAAGVERFGIYALKAQVLALRGDADAAMKALTRAADLGWRRSWWAQHDAYFSALQSRSDFRALMARVDTGNGQLRSLAQLSN